MRLFQDTTVEAEEEYLDLLASASPLQKAEMVSGLYLSAFHAAVAGVRDRSPRASPADMRSSVARLLLGDALAKKFLARASAGGSRAVSV